MEIYLLKPSDLLKPKQGTHRDGGGLWFQVKGKGRSWLFRYTFDGVAKTVGLGPALYKDKDVATATAALDAARDMAGRMHDWLREGKDPKKEREDAKRRREIEAGQPYLVKHFLARHIDTVVKNFPPKRRGDAENHCETIRTTIGDLVANDVKPRQLAEKTGLYDLWDGPQRAKARALRQQLVGVFAQADAEGVLDFNPTDPKRLIVVLPRKKHQAKPMDSIPVEDVPRFLAHMRETVQKDRHKSLMLEMMLEMIIFSSVRSGEIRLAKWKEIKGNVWEVPPEPGRLSKGANKMRPIPLTRPMLAVIKKAQALRINPSDDEAPIFPNGKGKPYPASDISDYVADLKWENPVKAHGFRNTLADWAEEKGFESILVERQQDHLPKEGTSVAVRYSHLVRAEAKDRSLGRRRKMMDAYADVCDPPRTDADNVIQFQA